MSDPRGLTPAQREILRLLDEAGARTGARILYRTEWLGYLPYGQYHWVHVGGARVELPDEWSRDDLLALESAGLLRRVGEAHEPADEMHEIVFQREDG